MITNPAGMSLAVFQKIHQSWHLYLQALAGLPDEFMTRPKTIGLWSVKDIMGHTASWERIYIDAIGEYLAGRRPSIFDLNWEKDGDATNARLWAEKKDLTLQQAWRGLTDIHREFLAAFSNPEVLEEPDMVALAQEISWKHYDHHAAKVRGYRRTEFPDEAGFCYYVMRVEYWPDLDNPEHWQNLEGSQEFIQCALEPEAVEMMANRLFAHLRDPALAVLVLDLAKFQPEAVKAGGRTTLSGHIHGWFALNSVVDCRRMVRNEAGRWVFPAF